MLDRHRAELSRRPGVVGTGIGKADNQVDPAGRDRDYEIRVFVVSQQAGDELAPAVEGVPLRSVLTGPIRAQ